MVHFRSNLACEPAGSTLLKEVDRSGLSCKNYGPSTICSGKYPVPAGNGALQNITVADSISFSLILNRIPSLTDAYYLTLYKGYEGLPFYLYDPGKIQRTKTFRELNYLQ